MNVKLSDTYPFNTSVRDYSATKTGLGAGIDMNNKFVLCPDNTGDAGHFAFSSLLFKCLVLNNDRTAVNLVDNSSKVSSVKLISTNHDRSHYESLLRKQNLDIAKLEKTGSLEIIYLSFDGDPKALTTTKMSWAQLVACEVANARVFIGQLPRGTQQLCADD